MTESACYTWLMRRQDITGRINSDSGQVCWGQQSGHAGMSQITAKRPEMPQERRNDLNPYPTIHKSG